jgi:hypothetical protein
VKEAIEIWLYPGNFNRNRGLPLSCSWYLVMKIIEHMRTSKERYEEGPVTRNMDCDN